MFLKSKFHALSAQNEVQSIGSKVMDCVVKYAEQAQLIHSDLGALLSQISDRYSPENFLREISRENRVSHDQLKVAFQLGAFLYWLHSERHHELEQNEHANVVLLESLIGNFAYSKDKRLIVSLDVVAMAVYLEFLSVDDVRAIIKRKVFDGFVGDCKKAASIAEMLRSEYSVFHSAFQNARKFRKHPKTYRGSFVRDRSDEGQPVVLDGLDDLSLCF